ncbi:MULTISPECIES: hypothetical protein [Paenibacillus]|jgi:hypothetical protein|uniref:Uncharacterized protein n=1 Tax=Paenibacillus baimaensis TaxID=2982185 RepID=A0ABT2U7H9_9BACL|nr:MULTISPECIES: hypothetical protein [unclassified Paenibacillus]MCU6790583.1 hypothetical protein [Paenibacillus sp. WQ 127069]OMF08412.1 hypothetical protein BK127_28825 [Paenibacillus sp. FSL H7-0331]
MIPFLNTWPYELIQQDVYFQDCPLCGKSNVLLPFKRKDLPELISGVKKLLVLPCCLNKLMIVGADRDYLLANQPLRNQR